MIPVSFLWNLIEFYQVCNHKQQYTIAGMQSLTGAHQYPCIITFLRLRLSEQRALSYLSFIFEKLVFLSLHMYLYSKKKCWKKSKNCEIRKKSENVKTPYKNLEKYGSFSEFRTSTEKSVMLATLTWCMVCSRALSW